MFVGFNRSGGDGEINHHSYEPYIHTYAQSISHRNANFGIGSSCSRYWLGNVAFVPRLLFALS